mgnify:CR=1 FL=1
MNILEILYLYLHYISFPFRLFLIYLIVTILFYYIRNTEDEVKINQYAKLFGKFIIWSFSMDIIIKDEDLIKYNKHLYSDRKMIVVFNHSSISDAIIMPGIFDKTSAVILNNIVPGQDNEINKKVKNIMIEKGKTTQKIIDFVNNRKAGGNMLFIAPGSGNTPRIPDNITEFTSKSAFIGKYPILPVLVKYEDNSLNHNADRGEDYISSFLKTLLIKDYKVKIKVLDLIEYHNGESIEEYKDRVYSIMNTVYKEL